MTFPIDVESTLQRYAGDEFFQEFLTLFLPVVNDCYRDGCDGKRFVFDDEQLTVEGWCRATGYRITPWAHTSLHNMIGFCRKAYECGQAVIKTATKPKRAP